MDRPKFLRSFVYDAEFSAKIYSFFSVLQSVSQSALEPSNEPDELTNEACQ